MIILLLFIILLSLTFFSFIVNFISDFRRVIPYLVATVVHHSTWIAENLNERHPLFLSRCWRQGNQENLKDLILEPVQMYCPVNEMQATGIPALYVFMHSQSLLNKEVVTAMEKVSSDVPAPAPPRSSTGKKHVCTVMNIVFFLITF